MAESNRPTGLTEKQFQPHYAETQSENNAEILDQNNCPEAMNALNNCSTLSDILENDQGCHIETVVSWLEVDKCDGNSCQTPVNGQPSLEDNLTAGARTNGRFQPTGNGQGNPDDNCFLAVVTPASNGNPQVSGQGSPDDNLRADASPQLSTQPTNDEQFSPEDNTRAGGISSTIQNGSNLETMNRNLDQDQTKAKLEVNLEKINGFNPRLPAATNIPAKNIPAQNILAQNIPVQHFPNNENRQNVHQPRINNINGPMNDINSATQNIPVSPGNAAENKLVIHCCEETLEHLNDRLLGCYNKNWKHIASRHQWDHERICHFQYKYDISAFKKLIFDADFSLYTVQNLLDDLTQLNRKDLIADYPAKWS